MATRSQALKIIEKILDNQVLYKPVTHKELAIIILDALEKQIKILPPLKWLSAFKKYDNGWKEEE